MAKINEATDTALKVTIVTSMELLLLSVGSVGIVTILVSV